MQEKQVFLEFSFVLSHLAMIGQMKSKTYDQASPTVGFNVEVVKTKKMVLNLWVFLFFSLFIFY